MAKLEKPDKNKILSPTPREEDGAVTSSEADISRFVDAVRATPRPGTGRGRLIFAMDATMSRQPSWDRALAIQSEMFSATAAIGGLDVQLIYFRGFGECRASKWVGDGNALARLMTKVSCRGGHTQIGRVLAHARAEADIKPVSALVFVGDAMEEEIDHLAQLAGELGLNKIPVFMFHEGHDRVAETAFREIARLSRGAYCRFSADSADALRRLLTAVAVYAAGGQKALAARGHDSAAQGLLEQLR
ncbi:FIG00439628: hypothetical protein [hydrothermal vent metagenome]|uniref:VWA domain-containing protein n=1 Tax=hydrothermal vent metagenome TaxID=652676 RepID=A0A3B0SXG1_9ZZZZ